jgi:hypothetical protein
MKSFFNQEVEVNAFYFTNKKGLKSYPRSITVEHQQYSFSDMVMQYVVRQGQHLVRLFDMTDGINTYRLRNEDGRWILISSQAIHA